MELSLESLQVQADALLTIGECQSLRIIQLGFAEAQKSVTSVKTRSKRISNSKRELSMEGAKRLF